MVRMGIVPVSLPGWASVFGALCIWIPAFTADTGVLNVAASPMPFAGDALNLLVRKSGKVTLTLGLPVFVLHETHDAPGHSSGRGPWPDTGSVGFLSCESSMLTVARF
mgnify:CR=1 FL=1